MSEDVGVNSRLDEIQAAVLRVKLLHLDAQNLRRQQIAAAYDAALSGTSLQPPARRAGATHVFHQYVLRVPDRAAVQAGLRAAGIGTGVHYPMPVHLQPAYRGRIAPRPRRLCRQSERASAEVLSLPMYPQLTDAQVEQVCAASFAASEPTAGLGIAGPDGYHPCPTLSLLKAPAMSDTPPDRLSSNPKKAKCHDEAALQRGVGVRFKGVEKNNVDEYLSSGAGCGRPVGNTVDRKGNPLTMKAQGMVEPYFRDIAADPKPE